MANFVASTSSESPARERRIEVGFGQPSDTAPSLLVEMTWAVLPSALQRSLGPSHPVWISTDQQSYIGISIYELDHPIHSTGGTTDASAYQLCAWALIKSDRDDPGGSTRFVLFECANSAFRCRPSIANHDPSRNGGAPWCKVGCSASFAVLNGRADRLSIDVNGAEIDTPICRVTYVVGPDGRPIWWADSILPSILDLPGGRYELTKVEVSGLTSV